MVDEAERFLEQYKQICEDHGFFVDSLGPLGIESLDPEYYDVGQYDCSFLWDRFIESLKELEDSLDG